MNIVRIVFLFLLVSAPVIAGAQPYDIVIKDGHVIDPANNIDDIMDLAISNGKIAKIADHIVKSEAKKIIDAAGMYVTPGFIDMHVHVFHGNFADQEYMNGPSAVVPDGFSFRAGVTTVVDAGSSGWRTFPDFKKQTIERSKTRVLGFLNIVGEGMRGGPFEQNLKDMSARKTAEFARLHRDEIVGIKLAHYEGHEWAPTDSAVEAGRLADLPVMIDFGSSTPTLSLKELFMDHLRPGDIFAHCYASVAPRESVVDGTGKVKPFVWEARERGILFDVGHGGGSFAWSQAVPAIRQGFIPDAISSDLHIGSMNSGMKDMANLISKFLNTGMSLRDAVLHSTWVPAEIIHRPELGNLSVGTEADVAVFSLRKGDFGFLDTKGIRKKGSLKMEVEMTIRAGNIVWDLNGIGASTVIE